MEDNKDNKNFPYRMEFSPLTFKGLTNDPNFADNLETITATIGNDAMAESYFRKNIVITSVNTDQNDPYALQDVELNLKSGNNMLNQISLLMTRSDFAHPDDFVDPKGFKNPFALALEGIAVNLIFLYQDFLSQLFYHP